MSTGRETTIPVRFYLAPVVAVCFALSGIFFDGFLGVVDYIVCFLFFLFFAFPILFERSVVEALEDYLPRFAREWLVALREKRRPKGPYDSNRVMIAWPLLVALWAATIPFAIDVLSDAVPFNREEVNEKSAVDRLLTQSAIIISISIFWILLLFNMLKKYYMGWYLKNESEFSKELPGCWHTVNVLFLVLLSSLLLMSSYVGQFISGNFGFGVMLGMQLFIMLLFVPGGRFLRGRGQDGQGDMLP